MLTQTMPALSRALEGQLPPQVVKAVMQALGNCGQDAVQRGGVAVMPNTLRGVSMRGQQGWNPYTTQNINNNGAWIPFNPNGNPFVDMPSGGGYRAGDWYTTHYGSPNYTFFSPITNELNSIYGSPTNFFGGNTVFENVSANNVTADTVTSEEDVRLGIIKLQPPAEAPGDNGANGSDGRTGPSGPPGDDGLLAGAGFIPAMPVRLERVINNVQAPQTFPQPYVIDVQFNQDTCALTVTRALLPPLVRAVNSRQTILNYYGPGQ